jgi:hypothetical protein
MITTNNKILQIFLTLLIFIIVVGLIIIAYKNNFIEKYVFGVDIEECVYDPVVQKLKNKVVVFLDDRVSPWRGHLDCLNHKKKEIMKQLTLCKGESSYTIDKEVVYLCVTDTEGNYYNEHMLMHVLLHELSHAICDEIGHTKKFDDIFNTLMNECDSPSCPHQTPIYDKSLPLLDDYCGVGKSDSYSV